MKALVARTDKAVGAGEEVDGLGGLRRGRSRHAPVGKQGTDALGKMPIVRSYVEDSAALMVRPTTTRGRGVQVVQDLFEPGTGG